MHRKENVSDGGDLKILIMFRSCKEFVRTSRARIVSAMQNCTRSCENRVAVKKPLDYASVAKLLNHLAGGEK